MLGVTDHNTFPSYFHRQRLAGISLSQQAAAFSTAKHYQAALLQFHRPQPLFRPRGYYLLMNHKIVPAPGKVTGLPPVTGRLCAAAGSAVCHHKGMFEGLPQGTFQLGRFTTHRARQGHFPAP